MILLDTNVVSELMRMTPEPAVMTWFSEQDSAELYLTAVSEAELRASAAILPAGRRRDRLTAEVDAVVREDFAGRVLPFDSAAARASMRRLPPRAGPWAGRSWRPTARSPPSPAPVTPRWRRAMARTSSTAGLRSSTHGRQTGRRPDTTRAPAPARPGHPGRCAGEPAQTRQCTAPALRTTLSSNWRNRSNRPAPAKWTKIPNR